MDKGGWFALITCYIHRKVGFGLVGVYLDVYTRTLLNSVTIGTIWI